MSHVKPNHHNKAPQTMLRYPIPMLSGRGGITKANCANDAIKRNMISGFEKVTRNAVMPLCIKVPFLLLVACIFLVGSER